MPYFCPCLFCQNESSWWLTYSQGKMCQKGTRMSPQEPHDCFSGSPKWHSQCYAEPGTTPQSESGCAAAGCEWKPTWFPANAGIFLLFPSMVSAAWWARAGRRAVVAG